ncbi:MAG: polymer-forming cytoskeletal protein [Anaerolineales bacterium]
MFNRKPTPAAQPTAAPAERVTSVLGPGITWRGALTGSGGVRIEGALDGDVNLRGLFVVGESGRVQAHQVRANIVIVAGLVRGDITAEKLEIRATGRVWGNVVTAAFATEEGAFLRGQIRMEDQIDLGPLPAPQDSASPEENAGGAGDSMVSP